MQRNGNQGLAISALLLAATTACTSGGHAYPSLALRPYEAGTAVSPPAPPPPPNRPATAPARLAELRAAAATQDTAFTAREPDALRLARAAAGQPFESAARASAMVAMADLNSKRAATAGTLAALDVLAAEAATALSPDPGVVAAQNDIAAMLARQDAAIARLWEVMGS
jgi:hypothetical protein